MLAICKVRPTTQVLYVSVLRLLAAWLLVSRLPDWSLQKWDEVLENFLLWLHDRGYPLATASRLPALRHGGASEDPLRHRRSTDEVLPRGR